MAARPRASSPMRPTGASISPPLKAQAAAWPGLDGMDLAIEVSCRQSYRWEETTWHLGQGYRPAGGAALPCRRRRLRRQAQHPALPRLCRRAGHGGAGDGDRRGDPGATSPTASSSPMVRAIRRRPASMPCPRSASSWRAEIPLFGICLGHQLLALALGAQTKKMHLGHRGANHPVKDLTTGKVEITSQNHGFAVLPESLPPEVEVTHVSLFDGSNEGSRSRASRSSRCNTTPKPRPARRTATTCSSASPI